MSDVSVNFPANARKWGWLSNTRMQPTDATLALFNPRDAKTMNTILTRVWPHHSLGKWVRGISPSKVHAAPTKAGSKSNHSPKTASNRITQSPPALKTLTGRHRRILGGFFFAPTETIRLEQEMAPVKDGIFQKTLLSLSESGAKALQSVMIVDDIAHGPSTI